ncbi:MAG: Smr/MutS family protein [Gammaproteobacteria bacterium]
MAPISELNADDVALFQEAIGAVKPLHSSKVLLRRPGPLPVPSKRLAREREVLKEMLNGSYDPSELETGEELLYCHSSISWPQFRKLRRGCFSIQAELDLHGMTVPLARQALRSFLSQCIVLRYRCVRVIHGKGNGSFNRQPVLKQKLKHWLSQRHDILAFCSARRVDGGTGAVYVLLKRGHDPI